MSSQSSLNSKSDKPHPESPKDTKASRGSNKLSKGQKIFLNITIGFCIFVVLLIVAIGISQGIQEENKKQATIAAEQARLAADPVTVNGIYTALNAQRSATGAPALSSLQNLATAAEQKCNDMVTNKYFDYKNPVNGKDSNSYITDNAGDMYFALYVSTIFSAITTNQTASDAVKAAVAQQATNLNNPSMDSVGWAVCQSPDNPSEKYIVGMLANKEEKPVAPVPSRASTPTYQYRAPTTCRTTYNDYGGYFSPTATTNCY